MLPLVFAFSFGCGRCGGWITKLTNESDHTTLCSVNSEPTLSAYDVAICPGQSLERYRFRGKFTCYMTTEPVEKCSPGGMPVS